MIHYITPIGIGSAWVANEIATVEKHDIPIVLHSLRSSKQEFFSSDWTPPPIKFTRLHLSIGLYLHFWHLFCLKGGLFRRFSIPCLENARGWEWSGYHLDIGTHESLAQAERDISANCLEPRFRRLVNWSYTP
jgi:hypothetical protein